jgi:phosphoenolpyruvate---glycerone phosphotransferase subunit DhaL
MKNLQEFAKQYEQWAENEMDYFNQLDAAQGDGDLGVTIVNGARALNASALTALSFVDWLENGGKAFRRKAPSTMGILIASAMIKAAKEFKYRENASLSSQDWIEIQEVMINEIKKRGEADLGDKTILDSFIPAANEFKRQVNEGKSIQEATAQAALVAKQEAEATTKLQSRIGRSSWLGERANGHIDGGAWYCYKTYEFVANHLNKF